MNKLKPSAQHGDILYVNRGLYKHYGIYAGNGRVIHFAPLSGAEINAENAVIHETDLESFLKGGTLKIDKKPKAKFSGAEIVERARSQIGSKGYNLVFHNCEHFAHWCKTGAYKSDQVNAAIDIAVEGVKYAVDLIDGSVNSKNGRKLLAKLENFFGDKGK